jgi:hypothetical protein
MIFEIANTLLLLCSLMLNIKILNITHNIQNKNKIQNPSASLADIAHMMSCDSCEACVSCDIRDSCDSRKENNVSQQNIYKTGTDNENDNINLLGNNRQGEPKEWTEIQISK